MTELRVKTFRCEHCRGTGRQDRRPCRNCKGKGYFITGNLKTVTIPEEARREFEPRPHTTRQARREEGRCVACGSPDLDRGAERCEKCRQKRRTTF